MKIGRIVALAVSVTFTTAPLAARAEPSRTTVRVERDMTVGERAGSVGAALGLGAAGVTVVVAGATGVAWGLAGLAYGAATAGLFAAGSVVVIVGGVALIGYGGYQAYRALRGRTSDTVVVLPAGSNVTRDSITRPTGGRVGGSGATSTAAGTPR